MSNPEKALECKNAGNAAFQAGNYAEAIKAFTEGIGHDATNHVLYSNRSAAYVSSGQFAEAKTDAEKTIEIKPDWPKGYSRLGTALSSLNQLDEAQQAFEKGLSIDPSNAMLKDGLAAVLQKQQASAGAPPGLAKMFGPEMWVKLATDPRTKPYMDQPDFVEMMKTMQQNPQMIGGAIQDPRVATALSVILGINLQTAPGGDAPAPEPAAPPKKKEPEPEPEPAVELTDEEKAEKEVKDRALAAKAKGNAAYKTKDFDTAIKHYNEAIEIDPKNMSFYSNIAAVKFEQQAWDDCIAQCKKAIEVGRSVFADFKLVAKAYDRIGKCYTKLENYEAAVDAFQSSLTENRTGDVLERCRAAEKALKTQRDRAYQDPAKALEAKEEGNALFKEAKYPEAVKKYTEAIKRAPKDPIYYSNRAATYMKLGAYPEAVKDCDTAIGLDEKFVKAYVRKAHSQFFMKEYHKCLETYEKALQIDPDHEECKSGLQRTLAAINRGNQAPQNSEEQQQRAEQAMNDPEIAAIMTDPIMRQILQDMSTDPAAAANHMKNPTIAAKIQKLVAAGIIQVR